MKGQHDMHSYTRLSLKAIILATAGSLYIGAAIAADATAKEQALEEVVVTGSRIPQPNMKSTSPIQVVSSEEIRLQGATDVGDILNNMPQQFQLSAIDLSSTTNPLSSPGGVSTADLRGLGPQRTLVLVDGRRLGIGDANTGNPNPSPDLNQIPAALIDHVEVVTGGASAVYGSDAVAGVVNFIMKRDFQGLQVDGQYGGNMHTNDNALMARLISAKGFPSPKHNVTDGWSKELSVVLGGNTADDKGNITAYFNFRGADPVSQGSRDFSACKLNAGPTSNTPACSGSANSNEFIQTFGDGDFTVVGNQLLPWPQANSNPPALFNSNPYQYLSHDDTRYSAGAFMHYDFSDSLKIYSDLSWMHDASVTQVAPSAAFEGGNPYSATGGNLVNCNNPLLSAQEVSVLCTPGVVDADGNVDLIIGRRSVEGGGRETDYDHKNYRVVLGLKGDVLDGWNYDVYGQYYSSYLYQYNSHYLSNQRINNSLQVLNVGGVPTCKSVIDGSDPACVPWNIWKDGGVTPAQVAYLDSPGAEQGTVKETVFAANLAGDLGRYGIKLPTANDGIGVSVGAEYRKDALKFAGDANLASGDLSGFGGAVTAIDASTNVKEYFTEARAPLIQDHTGIKDLVFDAGYRYSDYDLAGGVSTYKFGLQYAPTDDIRFRGSFQRAIRAPNIIDLFNPQSVTNTSVVSEDPCAGTSPTASAAACARTGVTAAQYGHIIQCPAGQCATLQGGNPLLKPETASTYSYGFTLSPRALQNFSASVDYYRIDVKDIIGNIGIDISLDSCLATGNPTFCNNIVRTPTGNLFGTTIAGGGYITGASINVARQSVSGLDVQAAYKWPLPAGGSLSLNFGGSYVDKFTVTPLPGEHTYDCSGLYGATCQGMFPSWRHTMRLTWKTPWDVLLSAKWRYIGSVTLETNTADVTLTNGKTDTFEGSLPSASYLDLIGEWDIKSNISVRLGINNVMDKDPPLISSLIVGTGEPNTYTTYDVLGRVIFLGVSAKF
jgi:iron complex outermembrane recepter protein